MYQVKCLFRTLCIVSLLALLTACTEKAPVYPDLEGNWKLERIETNATGNTESCNLLYWAFQLGIIKLNDRGTNENPQIIGAYLYDEGAKTLTMSEMYIGKTVPTQQQLQAYGIPSVGTVFNVLQCDGDNMVLRCEEYTLYLRSF